MTKVKCFKTIFSKLTINNLVKYIVQGIAVAVAAYVILIENY
jgi:flagellar biosynthesis protein FlhB